MKKLDRATPRTQQEAFGTSAKLHDPQHKLTWYELSLMAVGVVGLITAAVILISEAS